MAIEVDILPSTSMANITTNFQRVEAALAEAVSRSGGIPNQMSADLDMNSNDILNIKTLQVDDITIDGDDPTGILERALDAVLLAEAEADRSETAADDAAAQAVLAEDAAVRAETAAGGVESPVSYEPQVLTEPQQAQARENIGVPLAVSYEPQTLTAPEQLQARTNISVPAPNNSNIAVYTTSANLTGVIPYDDTAPQSTEGDEILTVTLTPNSASSRVRITFSGWCTHNTSSTGVISALFIDSETSARRAMVAVPADAGSSATTYLVYEYAPGDTVEHTYKIRTGIPSSGGGASYRWNGSGGTRVFGGTSAAVITVNEV
jgi:hypothetical protein